MKAKRVCVSVLLTITLLFNNCTKDSIENSLTSSQESFDEYSDFPKICTELHKENPARAFGRESTFWNKSRLRVRFLEGSEYIQSKVRQYASEWSRHAELTFQFVDSEPSDIRISFDGKSGSWSYVGRNNQYISPNRATMNFGWLNNRTSESEFRRTTLHEFGHAIGLSHEHQHPQVTINWNREAVYAYYARSQDWSRRDVDGNIFQRYSANNTNFSNYDPRSIMHYYIPQSLVNGPWNSSWNTRLSSTDISFIAEVYPGEDAEEIEVCHCPDTQVVINCEDFENHSQTSFDLNESWSRWSTASGSPELQTYSWGKVLKVQFDDLKNPDIVYHPRTLNQGVYELQWEMYIGEESSAYFNIQKFVDPGQEFGGQFYFDTDLSGRIEINGMEIPFEYEQAVWNNISLTMNFDEDWMAVMLNGGQIASWPISWRARSENGTNQFGGINFYAIDADSRFWLDDFCLSESSVKGSADVRSLLVQATMLTEPKIRGQ